MYLFGLIFAKNYQDGNNKKIHGPLLVVIFSFCCCFLFCVQDRRWLLLPGVAFQYYFFSQSTQHHVKRPAAFSMRLTPLIN